MTERYSEGLAEHQIPAARTAIQLNLVEAGPAADVVVNVALKAFEGNESVRVDVPDCVADLSGPERAVLVLDVVAAAMARLAGLRAWPSGPLDQARDHVIDHRFAFETSGPWKVNRARGLRARPVLRVNDDGWGEKAFEVAETATGRTAGFTRAETTPINSVPSFKRDIRQWRWADDSRIECPAGSQIRLASEWGALSKFDVSDVQSWPVDDQPVAERSPISVRVQDM